MHSSNSFTVLHQVKSKRQRKSTGKLLHGIHQISIQKQIKLEYGPMTNVMAALLNIGDALYSTLQSLADAQYYIAVQ